MSEQPLIEWTSSMSGDPANNAADVTVFPSGLLRLGPRFSGGQVTEHRLSADDLDAVGRYASNTQGLGDINPHELQRQIVEAVDRERSTDDPQTKVVSVPQRDAATTILRATAPDGRSSEIRVYDLMGKATRYPQISSLQRLRAIEERMLQLAEAHSGKAQGRG